MIIHLTKASCLQLGYCQSTWHANCSVKVVQRNPCPHQCYRCHEGHITLIKNNAINSLLIAMAVSNMYL